MQQVTFTQDLREGERVEELFAEVLVIRGKHKVIHKALGNFKPYDLLGDRTTTYEVKFDRKAKSTGNLAFEYRFNGEPSGLATTTADFWVQYDGTNFYIFETHKLKDWLRFHMGQKTLRSLPSGQGAFSVLVPISNIVGREFCETIPWG
jgi:hypothetical protein